MEIYISNKDHILACVFLKLWEFVFYDCAYLDQAWRSNLEGHD